MLESFDCQVAAVDYRLPDWDGLRLVGEMRSRRPRLQAMLMTSYAWETGGDSLEPETGG